MGKFSGKTVLLINTGWFKKKFILKKLKKLGLTVVCLNKEKNWAAPYVDHWIISDNFNHAKAVEDTEAFLAANPGIKIDGALTFWEGDVLLTAKITDRFNLIGIPFKIAKRARNKFLFRKFCHENGIRAPQHTLVKNKPDLDFVCNNFSFPLVVKPAYGSTSSFVVKAEDKEELFSTYNYVRENMSINIEPDLNDGFDILVEEYIDGEEVDIDIILQNGKVKFYSISDNYQTKEPFFVETGQAIPSNLPAVKQNELINLAEETLEKLGVQNGVIHFEAKSTVSGPVPIEANLRMGGDEVHSFVLGAWGVDLVEGAVDVALGNYIKRVERPSMPLKYMSGSYFLSDYSGILSKLDINQKIKTSPYLEEIHFYKKIGEPILSPPEGFDYLGWITARGSNALDSEANLKDLLKFVKYEVAKFDQSSTVGKTLRRNRFSLAVINKNLVMRAAKLQKVKEALLRDQKKLHLGILGNKLNGGEQYEPHQITGMVGEDMRQALLEKGYEKVSFFDFKDPWQAITSIKESSVDIVLNTVGKTDDLAISESHVAALLETLQVPYTGSDPLAINLCTDKIKVKKLLDYHKIPTPKWDYAYTMDDAIDIALRYPLIVKPGNSNGSIGVTNDSVVFNEQDLKKQLEKIITDCKLSALVEEYIEGDEYNVSILGSEEEDIRVLPLCRYVFNNLPEGYRHIFTYEAKWSNLPVYKNIVRELPPADLNKKLEALITEIALDSYLYMGCRDYGIIDVRVDKNNNPYVLEINPNPPLRQDDCLPMVGRLLSMDYGDLLEEIISITINRYSKKGNL